MAGITLTLPTMMLFGAFGVFVGAGHAAVLSIKLGEGDFIGCEKIVGETIALKLLFFFILPPLVFFNLDRVLMWCGGAKVSAEAFAAARSYLKIVIFSNVFSHLAFGLSALTRAEGAAVKSMMSMVVGFGANMILDPLFIFGFKMGIDGAAWATNIAMALSFLWAARYYARGDTVVIFRWWRVRLYREFLWKTSAIGFAPFLQQLLSAAIGVSMTMAFTRWATDTHAATMQVASLGVFHGMLILTIMPILGVQQGLQPIFGYNWGARNYRRVLGALKLGFAVTSVLCVIACIVQTVPPFPRLMAYMFVGGDNEPLLALSAHDLIVGNCMYWTISINVLATTYFQSVGRPMVAVVLSTLRQGVILIPCVFILPYLMDDKMLAIWLALPISDIVCQLVTIPPFLKHYRFLSSVRERKSCAVA